MRKLFLVSLIMVSCSSSEVLRSPATADRLNVPKQSSLNTYLKCGLDKLENSNQSPDLCPSLTKWNNSTCTQFIDQLATYLNIEANTYFANTAREKRLFRTNHGNALDLWTQIKKSLETKVRQKVGQTSYPQSHMCLSKHLQLLQGSNSNFLKLAEAHLWVRSGLTPPSQAVQRRLKKRDSVETVLRVSRIHGQRQVTESVFQKSAFLKDSMPHNLSHKIVNDFQDGDILLISSQELTTKLLSKTKDINSIYDLAGVIKIDSAQRERLKKIYGQVLPWNEIKKSTYIYYVSPQIGFAKSSFYDLEQKVTQITLIRWYDQSVKGKSLSAEFGNYASELFENHSAAKFDYEQNDSSLEDAFNQWSFIRKVLMDKVQSENYYDILSKQSKKTILEVPYIQDKDPLLWTTSFNYLSTRLIDELRVDPHFEVISEWTNFRKTESHVNFQILMETIHSWAKKDYRLNTTLSAQDINRLSQLNSIYSPSVLAGEFFSQVPKQLENDLAKASALKLFKLLTMHLAKKLESYTKNFQQKNRQMPSFSQQIGFLEELRDAEWNLIIEKRDKTKVNELDELIAPTDHPIHYLFRPPQ